MNFVAPLATEMFSDTLSLGLGLGLSLGLGLGFSNGRDEEVES